MLRLSVVSVLCLTACRDNGEVSGREASAQVDAMRCKDTCGQAKMRCLEQCNGSDCRTACEITFDQCISGCAADGIAQRTTGTSARDLDAGSDVPVAPSRPKPADTQAPSDSAASAEGGVAGAGGYGGIEMAGAGAGGIEADGGVGGAGGQGGAQAPVLPLPMAGVMGPSAGEGL